MFGDAESACRWAVISILSMLERLPAYRLLHASYLVWQYEEGVAFVTTSEKLQWRSRPRGVVHGEAHMPRHVTILSMPCLPGRVTNIHLANSPQMYSHIVLL
jgi:hypothetical protein